MSSTVMESGYSELRNCWIEISRQLSDFDIKQLYFQLLPRKRKTKFCPITLLEDLETEHVIDRHNVTKLIEALKEINLNQYAYRLNEYQRKIDEGEYEDEAGMETHFAGRSAEIKQIQEHMATDQSSSGRLRAVFISGMPGVGKTTLSKEFRDQYLREHHSSQHFIGCRGFEKTDDMSFQLKEELQMSLQKMNFKVLATKMRHCRENLFIILDNVEDIMNKDSDKFKEFLKQFIDAVKGIRNRSHRLMITSRIQLSSVMVEELKPELLCISLDNMKMKDSKKLLKLYLGDRRMSDEDIESLAKKCGHHPLSMALLGNRLKLNKTIKVSMIKDAMEMEPLSILRMDDELKNLNNCLCIESCLQHMFNLLEPNQQIIMTKLACAADTIKEETAKMICAEDKNFSQSVLRLLEFNLIHPIEEKETKKQKKKGNISRRYFMHLLIRSYIHQYCKLADGRADLKKANDEAKQKLLEAYVEDMKSLSKAEFENPRSYARAIILERSNYLPVMGDIYDMLISKESDHASFTAVNGVASELTHNIHMHANFYSERVRRAKRSNAPLDALLYMQLQLADITRVCGKFEDAKKIYRDIDKVLSNSEGQLDQRRHHELRTRYYQFYGRYSRDLPNGQPVEQLKKSVRMLTNARDGYEREEFFSDRVHRLKELAMVHNDLGSVYMGLAKKNRNEVASNLRKAKAEFESTQRIYEQFSKTTSRLFEVYLNLADCSLELLLFHDSSCDNANAAELTSVSKLFEEAENIAGSNKLIIFENPERMSILHYNRAIFRYKIRYYDDAAVDAYKAFQMQRKAYGRHSKTLKCLILLGNISCKVRRHLAFKYFEQALNMGMHLVKRGQDVSEVEFDVLDYEMNKICERLGKDYNPYSMKIEAIRTGKISTGALDEISTDDSSSDADRCSDDMASTNQSDSDKESESGSRNEDEGSSAPPFIQAQELAKKMEKLKKKNPKRLQYLSHLMTADEIDGLISKLQTNYSTMRDDERTSCFEKGSQLYIQLNRLEESPFTVIEEHRSRTSQRSDDQTSAAADNTHPSSQKTTLAASTSPIFHYKFVLALAIGILAVLIMIMMMLI